MMRKKWFHTMMTAWTRVLVHGFEFSASVMCCQPSHMPQMRSREIQILCYREDHLSIREVFFVCTGFFFIPKGNSSFITKKGLHFFSAFMLLGFSDHTVWGHEELSQEWFLEEAENPSWKYIFSLGCFPRIPHWELSSAGRRMDGLRSSPTSAVHVSWSPSRADDCL